MRRAFTTSRTKRYIELLLNSGKRKDVTLYRGKRFITKLICDKILGRAIKATKSLCEGKIILGNTHSLMLRVVIDLFISVVARTESDWLFFHGTKMKFRG